MKYRIETIVTADGNSVFYVQVQKPGWIYRLFGSPWLYLTTVDGYQRSFSTATHAQNYIDSQTVVSTQYTEYP